MKTNLLDFTLPALTEHFAAMGEKPFRAKQVMRWMHQMGQNDFDAMTDLAKSLRAKLHDTATVTVPSLMLEQASSDGTRKWLLDVGTGNRVETVFIPEDDRGTLCVSSQVAARWNAPSARPAARASTATSAPPRSSASCGGRTNRWG